MNSYKVSLAFSSATDAKAIARLAAVTIGNTLSPNFDTSTEIVSNTGLTDSAPSVVFRFDLPFSLSNLADIVPIGYDTRFQNVKEFLDKPYVVAGRIVTLLYNPLTPGAYDVQKDYGNFMKYPVVLPGANLTKLDLYIGIANGTLTESYAPFGITGGSVGTGIQSVKIYEPNDLIVALVQDAVETASQGSGTTITPPFNPNTLSIDPRRRFNSVGAVRGRKYF